MAASDAFREQMKDATDKDASTAALVEEACRIIDRLDHIDQIVTGKSEWIQLMHFRVPGSGNVQTVKVSLDGVLSEARQQAGTLNAILTRLGVGKADMSGAAKAVDPIDDLAARRSARGAGTASRSRRAGA